MRFSFAPLPGLARVALLAFLAGPLPAQAPAAPQTGPQSRAEIEAFVDGLMASYLRDKHIAGATVSIVRDTSVLFAKGYGWADVTKRIPVDPAKTMFRIGSIAKTFTWTAVMQLVEQGKLNLDTDINTYLDFKVPATFPEPITLKHVLTHTVGLEEDSRELFTDDPKKQKTMKEFLPAHMPKRVRPVWTYSSYSNWAAATAGYIVERVSGLSFDDYVDKMLLAPLGMTHTTSRQPLPSQFEADMSKGYQFANGTFTAKPFEIVNGSAPAGSIAASATDMANWMIAHLNHGAFRGQRILAESTSIKMQTRIQGHDPRIPGFAHGFYEQTAAGPRAVGHGGDTQWFHSDMVLLPNERVGFFVSFNTDKGSAVSFKPFADDVLGHYYPQPLTPIAPTKDDRKANAKYAGEYLFNRMSYTTFQKSFSLASPIKIAVADSGALVAQTPFGPVRFVQVDSNLFRDVASHDLIAFKTDARGNVTHAFLSITPMMVLEKRAGLASPSLHLFVLGSGLVLFLGLIYGGVKRLFTRSAAGAVAPAALVVRGRRAMVAVAVCMVVFGLALVGIASNAEQLVLSGDMGMLSSALALPVLGALGTLAAAVVAALQWMRGVGTTGGRVRFTLIVFVALVFVWSLNSWNLLGWRY